MGNQVAFKDSSPDKGTVAHELTHVLQQTRGPARKAEDGGIDTSGEAEAEEVEAAVKAGEPALKALNKSDRSGEVSGDAESGGATGKSKPRGEARNVKAKGVARKGFGVSMTFSKEGFENSNEYTIWDKTIRIIPFPAAPWFWLLFAPSLKVQSKTKINYAGKEEGTLTKELAVTGELGIGVGGGVPDVIEAYGTVNPAIAGAGTFKVPPKQTWTLEAGIVGTAALKVGVKLCGVVDKAFEFGNAELFKITGIYFDNKGFQKNKLGFEWGEDLKRWIETAKKILERIKKWGKAAKEKVTKYAKKVGNTVKEAWNWVKSWF